MGKGAYAREREKRNERKHEHASMRELSGGEREGA